MGKTVFRMFWEACYSAYNIIHTRFQTASIDCRFSVFREERNVTPSNCGGTLFSVLPRDRVHGIILELHFAALAKSKKHKVYPAFCILSTILHANGRVSNKQLFSCKNN